MYLYLQLFQFECNFFYRGLVPYVRSVFIILLSYICITGSPAVTSADLDMTLMVCLLRNLPPVLVAPANGFDLLPNPNEISDGANITRLKYYKNFLVSHSEDGTLSNVDYVGIWNTLEQVLIVLEHMSFKTIYID